eukprot:90329_1
MAQPCRDESKGDGFDEHDHHGHDHHDHDHTPLDELDEGDSLFSHIDIDKVICLNEAEDDSCKGIFKSWTQRFDSTKVLKSDEDDPEMILLVPFTSLVKIRSFKLIPGPDGSAPKSVKIWVNREDIDFETAQDSPSTQSFDLVEDFDGAVDYHVRPSKFMNVHCLAMYFPECLVGDCSQINYLGFKGEKTSEKRRAVVAAYEARANLSDHKTKIDEKQGYIM